MAYGEEEDEIQENDVQGRNAFRDAEKKYQLFRERKMKMKNGRQRAGKLVTRPTDLSDVIDLHDTTRAQAPDVVRYMLPDYQGAVYTFSRHPGLVYLPAALPTPQQRQLLHAALTDFPQPPARTNHNLQYGPLPDLMRAAVQDLRLNWLRRDDPHAGPSSRRMGCGHVPPKPHRFPSPVTSPPVISPPVTTTPTTPEAPPPSDSSINSNNRQREQPVMRHDDVTGVHRGDVDCTASGATPVGHVGQSSGVSACAPLKDGSPVGGGGGEGCLRCCDSSGSGNSIQESPRRHRRRCSGSGSGGDDSPRSSCSGASEALAEEFEELRLRQQQYLDQREGQEGHHHHRQQDKRQGSGGVTGAECGQGSQRLPPPSPNAAAAPARVSCVVAAASLTGLDPLVPSVDERCGGDGGDDVATPCVFGGSDAGRDNGITGSTGTAAEAGASVDPMSPSFEECWSPGGVGPAAEQLVRKLRWATLGPQFDWTQRQYDFCGPYRSLPACLGALARQLAAVVDRLQDAGLGVLPAGASGGYQPDAAIINYYQKGDMLGGHLDDVERDMALPIVSVSLGCPAVFLMGGPDKQVNPTALMVRGGDVLVLAGPARSCYHGVPRVLDMDAVPHPPPPPCFHDPYPHHPGTTAAPNDLWEGEWSAQVEAYARVARINISVRAVL